MAVLCMAQKVGKRNTQEEAGARYSAGKELERL